MSQETLDFIQKATNMVYSEEQAKLIGSEGGACVLACAGSGKTTAMTHLIARRLLDKSIRSGRRILGVTFSKTGATEMDERLEKLLDVLDINANVKMKTLHAFCLEFLKDVGAMRGRSVIAEYEKQNVLGDIGKRYTKGWKYEDAEAIASLITLQRGSLRSRQDFITSVDFRSTEMASLKYTTVYDMYAKYKAENNLIDFDDMLLLAHWKLMEHFYREDFMNRYECVMVDEAQDMSVLQYKIVFQLLGKNYTNNCIKNNLPKCECGKCETPEEAHIHEEHVRNTLVLIGDDDQCIYEWMGSKPQGLSDAKEAYRLPLYTLSTNYRCPQNVLSAAARCISYNTHSIPKSMNAHKSDGTLRFEKVSGGFALESKHIADQIRESLDAGVDPRNIAVLARNGTHLSLVWLFLTCYGIKSKVFGGQSTGADALLKHICSCFRLLTSTTDAGNVLYALIGGNKRSSDKLASLINLVDGSFQEWLEYFLNSFVPALNVPLNPENAYASAGKTWKDSMRELYYSGSMSNGDSINQLYRLYMALCKTPREFYLEVLNIYFTNMDWKYKSEDSRRVFKGTIKALKILLTEDYENSLSMLYSLDKHKAPHRNYVTLSTAHSAKGREWDTVYLICDDVYAFPSQISISNLEKCGDNRAVKRYIEAERRLHYVAMTRAKDTLCIVGGDVTAGKFLHEALTEESAVVT